MSNTAAPKLPVGSILDEKTKTWSGPKTPPLFDPNESVGHYMITAMNKEPNLVTQISHDDGHEMQNWEIVQNSVRISLNLRDLGFKEGDVIGFAAGNSRHSSAFVIGASLLGTPLCTLDPYFDYADIVHIFSVTKPKLVACDVLNYAKVQRALTELGNPVPVYVFDKDDIEDEPNEKMRPMKDLLQAHVEESTFKAPKLSDGATLPVVIICTSGTTGPSKSIPLSHAALLYMCQDKVEITKDQTLLSFSTMYWLSGLNLLTVVAINNVQRIIVNRPFEPQLCLDILKTRRVNHLSLTPMQLQLLISQAEFSHDLLRPDLKIYLAGSSATKSLKEQFSVPVFENYSLTETRSIANEGMLGKGIEAKIVDKDGNRLGIGEQGEICVKSWFPFLGYYRNEEATRSAVKEGFFHTGDLGYFDERCFLRVVDRMKDIFKYKNFHVDPTGIERVLKCMAGLKLVSVVAIPDPVCTGLPAAVVVRQEDSGITKEMVHQYAKDNLPPYKWLRGGVFFADSLPMTPSGKVIRRKVEEMTREMYKRNPEIDFEY